MSSEAPTNPPADATASAVDASQETTDVQPSQTATTNPAAASTAAGATSAHDLEHDMPMPSEREASALELFLDAANYLTSDWEQMDGGQPHPSQQGQSQQQPANTAQGKAKGGDGSSAAAADDEATKSNADAENDGDNARGSSQASNDDQGGDQAQVTFEHHDEDDDNPRNDWEHVQLLMGLGGQQQADLPPPPTSDDGRGGAAASRRTRGRGSQAHLEDGSGDASGLESGKTGAGRRGGLAGRRSMAAGTDAGAGGPSARAGAAGRKASSPAEPKLLLSAAEKRANHTSSEQRRRNAIKIGFAELSALEVLSVNGVWPSSEDVLRVGLAGVERWQREEEGIIKLNKTQRALLAKKTEAVDLRKRETPNESDLQQQEQTQNDNLQDPTLQAASEATPTPAAAATDEPPAKRPRRGRKGKAGENDGNGTGSASGKDKEMPKAVVLQKAAALADWLRLGNDYLADEVHRLEEALGVSPDQVLDDGSGFAGLGELVDAAAASHASAGDFGHQQNEHHADDIVAAEAHDDEGDVHGQEASQRHEAQDDVDTYPHDLFPQGATEDMSASHGQEMAVEERV